MSEHQAGWQQRIFALRKDAPSRELTTEEEAEHRGWTDALNAVCELFAGQNAKDAHPLLPEGALEEAFREGYDFGQADRRWDVTDADSAWRKSATGQNAKDALQPPQSCGLSSDDPRTLALAIIRQCAAYVRGYLPRPADYVESSYWSQLQQCADMMEAQPNAIITAAATDALPPDETEDARRSRAGDRHVGL